MHRAFAVAVGAMLGCSGAGTDPSTPARPQSAPALVVLVVVDQLPLYTFEHVHRELTGGLARLLREGAFYSGELPYASTFTAPGHATIGTGALPRVHGVIGNSWLRRDEGRDRAAEYDLAAPVFVLADGATTTDNGSSRMLRVDGVSDALRRATGGEARSVAVSLKARAACFMTGRRPDLAIWLDDEAGAMTTSRAYADVAPAWLREHARSRPVSRFLGATWTPLDPTRLAALAPREDAAPGEGDIHGLGTVFPHRVEDLYALLHTPFADELVLEAVDRALTELGLGRDRVPDLLAIGLNALDYAGHNWGPDSWEAYDVLMRVDRALGDLFARLDRDLGPQGWAVVLTSDHGATPVVERAAIAGARRIPKAEILARAETAASAVLGQGPWVDKVVSSNLYMHPRWLALPPATRERSLLATIAALRQIPNVASVHATSFAARGCSGFVEMERLVCDAIAAGASGEVFLVPTRGSLITEYTSGTHHDAPSEDTRRVPILVRAPGVRPGRAGRATLDQIAPTVSSLLGIPAPPAAGARSLIP